MKSKLKIIIPAIISVIAIIIAAVCIKFEPDPAANIKSMLTTAQKYLVEQNYEQAIAEFNKIIELDPKNADAYLGLAEAYDALGEYELAEEMRKHINELLSADQIISDNGSDAFYSNHPENVYDENGRLKCEYIFDENGKQTGKYFYYYRDDGTLSRKEYCERVYGRQEYDDYDERDVHINDTHYSSNGVIIGFDEYYANEKRYKSMDYYDDGSEKKYTEYNESGDVTYRRAYNEDGTVSYEEIFDYDNDEYTKNQYYPNSNYLLIYKKRISNDLMLMDERYYENGIKSSERIYTQNGINTEFISYYENGNMKSYEKYDELGNEVLWKAGLEDGSIRCYRIREYYANTNVRKHVYTYGGNYLTTINGSDIMTSESLYDEEGVEIREITYHDDTGIIHRDTEYKNVNGKSIRTKDYRYTEDGTLAAIYHYDGNGDFVDAEHFYN